MSDFEAWLEQGIAKNWITQPFCNTHDGYQYLTQEQEKEFDEGFDPCVLIIQLKGTE